jgi:CRISPR/Cas system-associated exonuclease Cas4 (RecB family)
MSRPVIQLHTIDQWLAVDASVRGVILQHLKVADRLKYWLKARAERPRSGLDEAVWVPCSKCEKKGWILKEPRYPGIHPSQLAGACQLKTYWEMEGREQREKHEARSLLTFDIGHALHHMFQTYGAQGAWGPHYWAESRITGTKQPLAQELFIEGSADAENILTVDSIPNAPIYEVGLVHEYKSMKKENFEKLTRPKPEHKVQANIYAKVLNRPVVVYLYFNKNDSNLSDFPVEFEPEVWAKEEAKARNLIQMYDATTPPEGVVGYQCTQCAYAYGCDKFKSTQGRGAVRR